MFKSGIKRMPAPLNKNVDEDTCASCGAHYMQNCRCTWKEISKAEEARSIKGKNVVTMNLSELKIYLKELKVKQNEKESL